MDPLGVNDANLSPQITNAHLELLIISESKATRHLISETNKHKEREMISIVEYVRKKNQKAKLKGSIKFNMYTTLVFLFWELIFK
jgi:hypothetical protein